MVRSEYVGMKLEGFTVVALAASLEALRTALETGSLYGYAACHAEARALTGRGVAYAVPLPNGERVVVRHNRHGGLFAPLTGDRFLPPTRAPHELDVSVRLRRSGVPTPEVVGYVIYHAGPLLRRCDVASREIANGRDLATILTTANADERRVALNATAAVVAALSACGARHHDLNVKNVLLTADSADTMTGFVLDVDRVEFGRPDDSRITERNLERFMRSARKWRALHGARIEEPDLVRIAAAVRQLVASRGSDGRRTSASQ